MTDVAAKDESKIGAQDGKSKAKGKKRDRVKPQAVGFVDQVPARSRDDYWTEEVAELREHAGRNKQYLLNSSTTASYLKGRYGVVTTTRTREDGKVDMFVQYPAKTVDGQLVPDEVEVHRLIERYGKKNED